MLTRSLCSFLSLMLHRFESKQFRHHFVFHGKAGPSMTELKKPKSRFRNTMRTPFLQVSGLVCDTRLLKYFQNFKFIKRFSIYSVNLFILNFRSARSFQIVPLLGVYQNRDLACLPWAGLLGQGQAATLSREDCRADKYS